MGNDKGLRPGLMFYFGVSRSGDSPSSGPAQNFTRWFGRKKRAIAPSYCPAGMVSIAFTGCGDSGYTGDPPVAGGVRDRRGDELRRR